MSTLSALMIPRRFNGPPASGNGGWVSGALAAALPGESVGEAVTVTLRQPPPLGTPLPLLPYDGRGLEARHGDLLVATAVVADDAPTTVAPIDVITAEAATASYAGFRGHPFPGCFVCGPDRAEGDGMRIFAGRVPDSTQVATTWTPTESDVPLTWAALDCPGGWAAEVDERPAVLGRITALVNRLPEVGVPHVIVGEQRQIDGRKTFTAATLYSVTDGQCDEVVATAEHVWIAIDPQEFR